MAAAGKGKVMMRWAVMLVKWCTTRYLRFFFFVYAFVLLLCEVSLFTCSGLPCCGPAVFSSIEDQSWWWAFVRCVLVGVSLFRRECVVRVSEISSEEGEGSRSSSCVVCRRERGLGPGVRSTTTLCAGRL